MKQLLVIFACLCFWFLAPAIIYAEPIEAIISPLIVAESVEPLKTYYLTIFGQTRAELNIDPPAMQIEVISQSGDTTIRCGDEQDVYICSPGKRLELEYDPTTPVVSFWGENLSEIQVRLQIDIYQIAPN